MNRIIFAAILFSFLAGMALAQEHWTEGPVWACGDYRTKQGHFDDYMKYLREHYVPTIEEAKKQGLVIDSKVFVQTPSEPSDWDVAICTLFSSYGTALDYSAERDAKFKSIQATHYKTADEEKQQEITEKRFEFRDFIGTSYSREVKLRPIP